MKIVDEQGEVIQDPDLSLGHLEPGKLLVERHEAVEYVPAVYEDQLVEKYENGGKLYSHVMTVPAVEAQDAWDEYEDVQVYVLYTAEELQAIEEEKQKEEEEKQQAEEAAKQAEAEKTQEQRVNLAVRTMSMMVMSTLDFSTTTDASVAALSPFYSEWNGNSVFYKKGTPFYYVIGEEVRYFRASQDTTSTTVYKPGDPGTESIYYEFWIAPDGIEIWQEVKGEYNAPDKGDRVHYPDADGPIYESLVNDNSYSPDVYPANWKKVSD